MKQKKNPLLKQAPSWLVYVLRPILFKSLFCFRIVSYGIIKLLSKRILDVV